MLTENAFYSIITCVIDNASYYMIGSDFMPAQKKIARDAIIRTAFEILRKNGIEAVNARSIARKLKCSTQPIYHCFNGMDELKAELVHAAEQRHDSEVHAYMNKSDFTSYMAYGMGFVFLAKKEKHLFRYLFLNDHGDVRKPYQAANLPNIICTICEEYGFSEETARAFHKDMTIYAYGLALGMNAEILDMTEPEIAEHFHTEFTALTAVYGAPNKQNGETKK